MKVFFLKKKKKISGAYVLAKRPGLGAGVFRSTFLKWLGIWAADAAPPTALGTKLPGYFWFVFGKMAAPV